jgi:glycine/D-amino acid oxidase-like deaminating enzyme
MMESNSYDVIIVGGGVMGSAIAYNLIKADPQLHILVIERDPTYVRSSTVLSDGNTRVQFNIKENVQISLYALEVLATFEADMATDSYTPKIAFRQQGDLFIVDNAGISAAKQGLAQQLSMGCDVRWLEPAEVKTLYPLFDTTQCAGATFGPKDGTMSPFDVLLGYRHKAIELGVQFLQAEVGQLREEGGKIAGIQLSNGDLYHAPIVVNAAGAWATPLAKTIGVDLPIQPIKRQVYAIEAETHFDHILPMLLLPNGQYVLHEGDNIFITGGALPDDPVTDSDFSWSKERFENIMWERLVGWIPAFDRLKIINGWAGLYAVNTFDHNSILGEYPTMRGFYLCNGFSGHGFQQCHAVGRYLAERILGTTPTLDLSIFSPQRLLENKPVFESPSRII